MIELRKLTKSFGSKYALRGVNLRVMPGESLVIFGPNGAGKSTLIRILSSLSRPTSGTVHIGGLDLATHADGIRRHLGVVSHAPLLYDSLTAEENLRFFAGLYGMSQPEPRITMLLAQVGLTTRRGDLVRTFSRGMVQRLAIARALLHDPQVLLLDEPDTGLDPQAAEMLHDLLVQVSRGERTGDAGRGDGERRHDRAEGYTPTRRHAHTLTRAAHARHGDPQPGARPGHRRSHGDPGERPAGLRGRCQGDDRRRFPTAVRPVRRRWPMRFWKAVGAIIWKDIRAELRTKDIFSSMFVFALLSVIIFNFAFELRVPSMKMVVPGIVWVAITFAGILGLNRAFVIEQDKGSFAGLLLAPVDRSAIYFGKMLGNLLFILVVEVILLPLVLVLFNISLLSWQNLLVIFLGTYGFAAVGTIFSAIAVNTRAREVMLPILLFPVLLPVLVAGVKMTGALLDGETLSSMSNWIRLVALYDVGFTVLAYLTFGFVVEE